jgi:hypothetical protein
MLLSSKSDSDSDESNVVVHLNVMRSLLRVVVLVSDDETNTDALRKAGLLKQIRLLLSHISTVWKSSSETKYVSLKITSKHTHCQSQTL